MVLGATGMVGSAMVRVLREAGHDVRAVGRLESFDAPTWAKEQEAVINCVGSVPEGGDAPDDMIMANAVRPHLWARMGDDHGFRLVHISTDCVFSGVQGMYSEDDTPDATDLYGRSKLCGEVGAPHLTLRTSVIGHGGKYGLVNWLMKQRGDVKGWHSAYWSGMTNIQLAKVIRDYVLPRPDLQGLFHVAGVMCSKAELLRVINDVYGLGLAIKPDWSVNIDRSLSDLKFRTVTGYNSPSLRAMIEDMHRAYLAQ